METGVISTVFRLNLNVNPRADFQMNQRQTSSFIDQEDVFTCE